MIKPLDSPLPGGSEGATVRLHPLLTGELWAPNTLTARSGGALSSLRAIGLGVPQSDWKWIPAPAFLIEHPTAGPLLVDTGLHPRAPVEPRRTMGLISTRLYKFRVAEDQPLGAHLSRLGLSAQDLKTVVMTHLHSDHAAGISELLGANFLVDRREWKAANRRSGYFNGYVRRHFPGSLDWGLLDFEGPLAEAFGGFESSIDLFGDGSVRLLATPGHTVGHLSVLVRLSAREALLTADAAYTRQTISEGTLPGIVGDLDLFRRSLARLQGYVEQSPETLVIPGHDPEAWRTLDPVYS